MKMIELCDVAKSFTLHNQGSAVIPVMKGRLTGYDVVWTPVFVEYGAMPATLTPSPGTVKSSRATGTAGQSKETTRPFSLLIARRCLFVVSSLTIVPV